MTVRQIAVTLLATMTFVWGVWCGEDCHVLFGLSRVAVMGSVAMVLGMAFLPVSQSRRFLAVMVSMVLLASGFYIGGRNASVAFNECVVSGETVRMHLAAFHRTHGVYPDSLEQMNQTIPGRRFLRGSLLRYQKTVEGYDISFGDRLGSHQGSATQAFLAHK